MLSVGPSGPAQCHSLHVRDAEVRVLQISFTGRWSQQDQCEHFGEQLPTGTFFQRFCSVSRGQTPVLSLYSSVPTVFARTGGSPVQVGFWLVSQVTGNKKVNLEQASKNLPPSFLTVSGKPVALNEIPPILAREGKMSSPQCCCGCDREAALIFSQNLCGC